MHRSDILNRANADYVDALYEQYQRDPDSVDQGWRAYFAGFEDGGGNQGKCAESTPGALGVHDLVHSYRELGHFQATLDPLGKPRPAHPLLDLQLFGMTDDDLDRFVGKGDFHGETDGTLRDLLAKLQATYCRNIGVEYMGISTKAAARLARHAHGADTQSPRFLFRRIQGADVPARRR